MASHLARRGGVWWARLVVPERLRQAAGRREFVQSCRTANLRIAKAVAAALIAEWRQRLMRFEWTDMNSQTLKLLQPAPALALGATITLSEADALGIDTTQLLRIAASGKLKLFCRVSTVSGHILNPEDLAEDPSTRGKEIPIPKLMGENAIESVQSGVFAIADSRHVADFLLVEGSNAVAEVVALEMDDGRWFAPETALEVPIESLEVLASAVAVVREFLAKSLPKDEIDRQLAVYAASNLPQGGQLSSLGKRAQALFSEAVGAYCSDPDGLPQRLASLIEVRQRKSSLLLFAEFMGDLPLSEITADLLRKYRDGPLREIPAKANNLPKALKRETMKATIQAIREAGVLLPLLSLEARQERMGHLSRLFAWLHAKDWISFNPASSLAGETGMSKAERMKDRRQRKLHRSADDEEGRQPFSVDELRMVFGQPQYKTGDGRHIAKGNATWYPFEYWLPLLGLYTGCRIAEMCQLHLGDVRQVEGHWVLDINQKTSDKRLKTEESSVRLVPLHPRMQELGFIDYCARLREEGFQRVFPELSYSTTDARYAKEPIRKMSAMLESLGMPRNSDRVFHCFRHNANDALMRVPMTTLPFADENLRKFIRHQIMGHQQAEDVNTQHYTSSSVTESAALVAAVTHDIGPIADFDIEAGIQAVRRSLSKKKGHRQGKEDMGPEA